ncbi:hypothetical protein PAHAL_1G094500 [Panicum hallii]|jgi:hypothetical protein|uniref:Uncharacterized protein n=1 Tax=Panicum hallii TaxID=206008 RepID=A0A2T8KUN2_9POAL|nr:hypothetical protein PAHAL_1G094500 [Panicum hallii]
MDCVVDCPTVDGVEVVVDTPIMDSVANCPTVDVAAVVIWSTLDSVIDCSAVDDDISILAS